MLLQSSDYLLELIPAEVSIPLGTELLYLRLLVLVLQRVKLRPRLLEFFFLGADRGFEFLDGRFHFFNLSARH